MPQRKKNGTDKTAGTDLSHPPHPSHSFHREGFIPPHGGYEKLVSYADFRQFIETRPPEVVANILICLIHQANYLLDHQLRRLERDFLEQGGLRERMTRARLAARAEQSRGGPSG